MSTLTLEKHGVAEVNARKLHDWLINRGGLLIWPSVDLGSAGQSVTTPFLTAEGAAFPPPGWKYPKAERHITDPNEVDVYTSKVVASFPIKLKRQGMKIVLTDASSRKVKTALAKHENSYHRFGATGTGQGSTAHALSEGGDTCEILVDASTVSLLEWLRDNPT